MALNNIKTTSIDMSVQIGKLLLKNPIITASGTFGYADEFEEYVNLQNIGAVITKGITLKPKAGNPQPRIKEVSGGLINWIGLENMGIDKFIETKLPVLINKKINYIVNIAGSTINEYIELAKICEINNIQAIELNISCPNVENGCLEFGKDPETIKKLVNSVREVYSKTLIVKLSSNVSYPEQIATVTEHAGADAISAINTVRAISINTKFKNGKITYSKVKGGLSGSCIKPIALNFIQELRNAIKIPIIGMGGIDSVNDVIEFLAVGSNAIQIGTANFTHPSISENIALKLEEILSTQGIEKISNLYSN